jgi:hypothetical protein
MLGVAFIVAGQLSHAGLVTGVTSSNALVAAVTGVSGISHTAGSINTGTITIDLEVFQQHIPITLDFTYGAGGADTLTTYAVTLNVKNSIPVASGGLNFPGFDVTRNNNASGAVASSGPLGTVAITSDVFAVQYFGALNIPNGFRWGGLAGGGATLAPGATATNTFAYRVTWDGSTGAGTSSLNFVANPEPTTLLLGALLLAPAAVMIRRRRNAAGVEEVPAE